GAEQAADELEDDALAARGRADDAQGRAPLHLQAQPLEQGLAFEALVHVDQADHAPPSPPLASQPCLRRSAGARSSSCLESGNLASSARAAQARALSPARSQVTAVSQRASSASTE